MGCDGGTIPTRDELVKLKKKPEKKDSDGHRLYKWQHCAITQQLLTKPVVACEMGRLYGKEAVIELLLSKDRSSAPARTGHIEKLKDILELQLTPNPAYDDKRTSVGDGMYVDRLISPWICPVTGLEMNGRFKFVFPWSSGRVVAERAVKLLQKDPAESENFREEDLVVLNPEEEELDLMNSKMVDRRAKVKAEKKAAKEAKKNKHSEFKAPAAVTPAPACGKVEKVPADFFDEPVAKKSKTEETAYSNQQPKKTSDKSKIKSSKVLNAPSQAGPSSTFNKFAEQARVEREDAARPVKDKTNVKNKVADLSKLVGGSIQEGGGSEVYKKLFTTHETALNQPRGNWVTFDPRYN